MADIDTTMVGRECAMLDSQGRHDWRVNPQQIIHTITVNGSGRYVAVEVTCAVCGVTDQKESRRRYTNNPADPQTWRPYVDGM